jgi:hypothetical protein
MLDLTGILVSTVLILMTLVRAVQLDRSLPWFQKIGEKTEVPANNRRPWQRLE